MPIFIFIENQRFNGATTQLLFHYEEPAVTGADTKMTSATGSFMKEK
jgi:hypothetical protein